MVRNVISFELRGASQPSVSWYQRSKVTSSSSSYSSSSDLLLTLSQEFNRWPAEEVEFNVKEINWSLPLRLMMFGRWSKKIVVFFVAVFLEMVISQFVVEKVIHLFAVTTALFGIPIQRNHEWNLYYLCWLCQASIFFFFSFFVLFKHLAMKNTTFIYID